MSDKITPILMPKWGLSMKQGLLARWYVKEGDEISPGDEIMDVETDKIANIVEAADGGLLRRIVGQEDIFYPVQALLAVMAPLSVTNAEIEAYVDAFKVPEIIDEAEESPVYEFAELPIGRIRYARRSGDDTPVILLHGFGGDLDNWLFNIDALSEERAVFALDLPGHGQSTKNVDSPDLMAMVATLVSFMDYLEIDNAHLVGHSMGGLIAGQAAIENPTRVASLSLISSAGLGSDINNDYISGFIDAGNRRELKPVLLNLFSDTSLVNRAMVEDLLKYKRIDGVSSFLATLASKLFDAGKQATTISDKLGELDIPLLLIAGANDAVIPASHLSSVTGATQHVLNAAGHMVQMEQASKVNELLKSHVRTAMGQS